MHEKYYVRSPCSGCEGYDKLILIPDSDADRLC
jgi:hypothetical protein